MKKQMRIQRKQQGFVLIIALILMVVMAIGAVVTFRLSGAANVINNNVRANLQAHQAAEAAINYCRVAVLTGGSLKIIPNSDGDKWETMSNWGTSNTNIITTLNLPDGSPRNPECLVEDMTDIFDGKKNDPLDKVAAFKITARGFSSNFLVDSKGYQQAGAQSWVQLTIVRTF